MQRIYILLGKNHVLRNVVLHEILEQFSSVDKETVYLTDADPNHFAVNAASEFLFGGGQVYILKHWDNLKESARKEWKEALKSIIKPTNPHTFILSAETLDAGFLREIAPLSHVRECKPLYGRDIISFIRQQFQKKNLTAENTVYEYLLDISQESLDEIDRMLQILIPAAEKSGKVTLQICQDLLCRALNHSIFDLIRGAFTHDAILSLRAFQSLRLEGVSLQQMFAMIYRTSRLLWSYKTKAESSLEEWVKKESISLFEARRLQEYSQKTTQRQLSDWFYRIAYLEEMAKTAREEVSETLFEAFLLEM